MIPEDAVEAAAEYLSERFFWDGPLLTEVARAVLEAAAPHMLAEAKADAWDECEAAKYEIRLNESGDAWAPVKDNPYRPAK